MTSRTVMAARVGPASMRSGPRSVYVCVSEKTSPDNEGLIDAMLKKHVRPGDRLFYPETSAGADPVIAFAGEHGLLADPMADDDTPPDLVIVIIDPLGDDAFPTLARELATQHSADLITFALPTINV